MDLGLEAYYKALNRNDYINSDGVGKFEEFINDNGFDDADIKDELYVDDATDCGLLDFDMNQNGDKNIVPLNPEIEDETARYEELSRILKIIFKDGHYTPKPIVTDYEQIDLLQIAANITQNDIDKAIEKYKNQMDCFATHFEKDKGLQHFVGVSEKEKIPFITYMVDSYTKERAKYFNKATDEKPMSVHEWSLQSGFMNELRKKYPKQNVEGSTIAHLLESAMCEYSKRIMHRLHFNPTIKIKDNLKATCEYIASVPAFIQKIMEKQLAVPPFQVELLIAVKAVMSEVNDTNDDGNDDDDDDEDEDNQQNIQLDPNTDYIGHVQQKLKEYPVTYFPQDNWDIDKTQQSIDAISRFLQKRYWDFRDVLLEYHKNKKNDGNDDGDDDEKKDNKYKERKYIAAKYPQNMRFDIFVDRRKNKPTKIANKGNKDDDKKNDDDDRDQITYYQPPDFCNFISMDHVPEFGFELIRKCIIPSKEGNITALDTMCGQLLTFMFNVEQKDEIKCYIVWNGQTMRFHGETMEYVLPHLFEQSEENIKFVSDRQQIDTVIQNFDEKTPDIKFHSFYKKLQSFDQSQ